MAALLPAFCFAQDALPLKLEVGSEPESSAQHHGAALRSAKAQGVYRLRVRYVKVEGRWAKQIPVPLVAGEILTSEKLSAALQALEQAITKNETSLYGLQSKGEVSVLYIAVDFDTTEASADSPALKNTVGVIFRPYYIDLSLVQIGNNVLPIPRSARPTFYENVPAPLLALNPVFGFSYDRAFGSSLSGAFKTDLLNLLHSGRANDSPAAIQYFEIQGQGIKSSEEPFYRADAGFNFGVRRNASFVQELALFANFDGADEPFGPGEHVRNAGVGIFGIKLKPAPNTRLWLNAGYRRTDDEFKERDTAPTTKTSANEQTGRVLLEAIPPSLGGFFRGAVWQESGWQSGGDSYERVVGRFGYEKEIPVMPNQTIGVEIIAGAGKASGDTPGYARFFGGNSANQFLYDSASSPSLLNTPTGPLIRSFGDNEAHLSDNRGGPSGADTFWHVNLNVTCPIPFLSRPLIPNVLTDIEGANGNPVSVRQVLRNQVDVTGPSMLMATLKSEGLSDEAAAAKAKEILEEIAPATHFIIDEANIYSIKPLLMFDAAGMSDGGRSSETWLAAGGGVQLTIVVAKLEVGYMHTMVGPTFGSRNNAFVRLVFQNLF